MVNFFLTIADELLSWIGTTLFHGEGSNRNPKSIGVLSKCIDIADTTKNIYISYQQGVLTVQGVISTICSQKSEFFLTFKNNQKFWVGIKQDKMNIKV